jgi:hypothetical protein
MKSIYFGILLLLSIAQSGVCQKSKYCCFDAVKVFSTQQWRKDTTGSHGYRFYAVKLINLDSMKGKSKKWLIDYLGEPNAGYGSPNQELWYFLQRDFPYTGAGEYDDLDIIIINGMVAIASIKGDG